MEQFLMAYGGELIALLSSAIVAIIARWKEKNILRKKGLLKDSKFYEPY